MKKWLIPCSIFIAILLVTVSCATERPSERSIMADFEDSDLQPVISRETAGGYDVRVMRQESDGPGQILFIHGAPGSIDASSSFFKIEQLSSRAEIITYDRPGYGATSNGEVETSLERQAEVARDLIRPGAVIVGHSFGATVALRMAMDYPEDLAGVILVAGVSAAEHEKIWWFNRPLEWPVFNWMLGGGLRSSNTEKLAHLEELPLMDDLWKNITTPVVIIHGTRDTLVPYENAEYAMERIAPEYAKLIRLVGENHFIYWGRQELIVEEILNLLNNPERNPRE